MGVRGWLPTLAGTEEGSRDDDDEAGDDSIDEGVAPFIPEQPGHQAQADGRLLLGWAEAAKMMAQTLQIILKVPVCPKSPVDDPDNPFQIKVDE